MLHDFFYAMHWDRFPDLKRLVGNHPISVELVAMGDDNTVLVYIVGEEDITLQLSRSLHRISDIFLSAPDFEEV